MIEATVICHYGLKATLIMPTINAAIERLQADDPCWQELINLESMPTKKRQTPWGKIKFERNYT